MNSNNGGETKMETKNLIGVMILFCWSGFALAQNGSVSSSGATPLEFFEQRIMPIFKSPQPASCIQCHLSAVDLKDYILPSHEQTFVSLRDQGIIDLAKPGDSTILLADEDYFGQAEIDARWEEGFPQSEKVPGMLFQ